MSTTTASSNDPDLRRGRLSAVNLMFLVLAAAAPLAGVVAAIPLVIGLGVGDGAPGMYVLMMVILTCFAVAYTTFSRHVLKPGAFYSYITLGLGPWVGVASATVAALSYLFLFVGVVGITSSFASSIVASLFALKLPPVVFAVLLLVVVTWSGRRGVDLNARVLGVVFSIEILIILALDGAILVTEGFGAFSLSAFDPSNVFTGAPGVAFAFVASAFIGFEATAIYSREAKDPLKTVPRATYGAVALLTILFVLTSWALIAGNGGTAAGDNASADPGGFVFATTAQYLGGPAEIAMKVLFLSSYVACAIGILNSGARYIYSLSRDGLLPRALGRAHPRHGSPHVAVAVSVAFTALVLAIGFIAGLDPYLVVGVATTGLATVGIVLLQVLVSAAAIAYFWRRPERHIWKTILAPIIASVGMLVGLILIIWNWNFIGMTTSPVFNLLPWVLVVAAIAAVVYLARLRRHQPDRFGQFTQGGTLASVPEEGDPTRPDRRQPTV